MSENNNPLGIPLSSAGRFTDVVDSPRYMTGVYHSQLRLVVIQEQKKSDH